MYGRGKKLSKPGKQNIYKKPFISEENNEKNKDRMIRDIWKTLIQKGKEKEERKGSEKKIKLLEISGHLLNMEKKIIIKLKK